MAASTTAAVPVWLYPTLSEDESAIVKQVYKFTECFFQDPRFDASHDFSHVKRVTSHAIIILESEQARRRSTSLPLLNPSTVILGALLHDVEDKKYTNTVDQSKPGIRETLLDLGLSEEYAASLQRVAGGVSYSTEIENPQRLQQLIREIPELAVVQDADRLDAIGAMGIGRCFTYGGAKSARSLDDSIDHFEVKLLKLESMMKTDVGRRMAAERSRRIREFMSWWKEESTC